MEIYAALDGRTHHILPTSYALQSGLQQKIGLVYKLGGNKELYKF